MIGLGFAAVGFTVYRITRKTDLSSHKSALELLD